MLEVVAAEFCRSQLALAARSAGFRSAKIKEFHFAFDITLCQLIKFKGCSFWSIFSADVSPQKFVTRALYPTLTLHRFPFHSPACGEVAELARRGCGWDFIVFVGLSSLFPKNEIFTFSFLVFSSAFLLFPGHLVCARDR